MKILRMMIWGLFFSLATSYGTITMVAVFNKNIIFTGSGLLEEFIIAAVLGPVIGLGSLIFLFERFPFFVQFIFHYLYVTVCVLIAGKMGGWYGSQGPLSIGTVLIVEVFVYILIWLVLQIMTQREVDEINREIKRKREGKR